MKPRVLFILKYRKTSGDTYDCWNHKEKEDVKSDPSNGLSSGLLNSANFVVDMLNHSHIDTKLVQVNDNNDIDREVHLFKPTHVIIEALWVVPSKFEVLHRLHPHVKWIIRGHSEVPFLAQEGVAIDWIMRYVHYKNVSFATNSWTSTRDIREMVKAANPYWTDKDAESKILYLPNYYPMKFKQHKKKENGFLDVACFGAIRPLKNQLIQAMAAIEYANLLGKVLRFHINYSRVEQRGETVLRNLEALFANTNHWLVKHEWMPYDQFKEILTHMDCAMQVSFSETFNIVAADCVTSGLPIVVSPEISWTSRWCQANPNDFEDIVETLIDVNDWCYKSALKVSNVWGLRNYNKDSKKRWLKYLS